MKRIIAIALVTALSMGALSCNRPSPAPPLRILASELYNSLQTDEAAARQRFNGRLLIITGEVANYWAAGPPGANPMITFQAEPQGSVHCSGSFPPPSSDMDFSRYAKGQKITVRCPGSNLRYWALNQSVQIWDCFLD